ncbi:MAG TPA: TonB-dependent receptor [Candidatus Eremiobacteraceae bacterium]|nr:TonB-dependent receptor [Candidatus Eremiobacteraceae bacterium]
MRFSFLYFLACIALVAAMATIDCLAPAAASTLGAIRGAVVDDAQHPVVHAAVVAQSGEGSKQTTTTDSAGQYVFPRLPFDTYTVTVTAAGLGAQSGVATVTSGSAVVLDFHLSKKTLATVTAVAKAGHPVSVTVLTPQMIQTLPDNFKLAHVTQTVPGVVPFSYDEPVARGFHGISYQIDGVPVPDTTSSSFSEVLDPRDVGSLEVYTGSFPAEFGGSRMGGLVNIITKRPSSNGGDVVLTGGNYASGGTQISDLFGGEAFKAYVSLNLQRSDRGLDTPTPDPPVHDAASSSNEFMRLTYEPDKRDSWALHFSNQLATFQIPIDTDPSSVSFSPPGTDDNQYEYNQYANIIFNRLSADGQGYLEIAPWYNRTQVKFFPDPVNDLASAAMASTFQDRVGTYYGLTTAWFRTDPKDNIKTGFTAYTENFASQFNIQFIDSMGMQQRFDDNVAQTGTNFGIYAEDKRILSPVFSANVGLRYDRSTGFTSGNQVSPRIEIDAQALNPSDTLHVYYGRLYAAPALEDTRRSAVVISGGNGLPVYDLKPETDSIYEFGFSHQMTPTAKWYVNYWARAVANVLDTTQIGSTPIFTIFNSTSGRAQGVEFSFSGQTPGNGDSYFLSYGLSQSLASGISGGTFLFSPADLQGANGYALEDHDQTNTLNAGYTWRFAPDRSTYASLQTEYGSGFPVQFENGQGRLPAHWTLNASYGRFASRGRLGYQIQATNITNNQYLIKLNNGFNTTQYARGLQITGQITAPIL